MNGEPQKRAQPASSGGPNAKAARASSDGPAAARASSGGPAALTPGEVTKSESGQMKRRLPLNTLGVHPENRGGVYCQQDVVKTLGIKLAKKGFAQEEADHIGVCVAEPSSEAGSFTQVAVQKCCPAEADVRFGLLSHNHL